MKISEIQERKVIHRPTLDFDVYGKRIYHAYEYYLPYNPGFKGNETQRLFAKWIDMAVFFSVVYFLFSQSVMTGIVLSVPLVIISGAVTECYFGTTPGKKIFRMTVIDDEGHRPTFRNSLKRNILCLANLYPAFTEQTSRSPYGKKTSTQMNFRMYLNNKICKTYIVKESKLGEVRHMLQTDDGNDNRNGRLID